MCLRVPTVFNVFHAFGLPPDLPTHVVAVGPAWGTPTHLPTYHRPNDPPTAQPTYLPTYDRPVGRSVGGQRRAGGPSEGRSGGGGGAIALPHGRPPQKFLTTIHQYSK